MPRTAFAARGICGFGLCGRAAWEPLHRFQSTRPVWDATRAATASSASPSNFNPRAPCGARPDDAEMRRYIEKFQSTRPVWGATLPQPLKAFIVEISIHAPRVGRDTSLPRRITSTRNFNPRAPCGARRHALRRRGHARRDFNPRAPCGARLMDQAAAAGNNEFQSTRPVWGATIKTRQLVSQQIISIHAPRVGRDDTETLDTEQCRNFNPRAPCGARPLLIKVFLGG